MSEDRYKQLTERLIAKTDRYELDWKEGAAPHEFQVSFANYSLLLSVTDNQEGEPLYTIEILDSQGNTLDRFSDEDLSRQKLLVDGVLAYHKMAELYKKARRQALGANKALDEILGELDRAR